jgi:hypothetical protein
VHPEKLTFSAERYVRAWHAKFLGLNARNMFCAGGSRVAISGFDRTFDRLCSREVRQAGSLT